MMEVQRLTATARLPAHAHAQDAGYDLYADEYMTIYPHGGRARVRTGIALRIPAGAVGWVCSRSGMAINDGVTVLNAPGIIDGGYTGEIGVVLINHGAYKFDIHPGDRIAQLVLQLVVPALIAEVDTLRAGTDSRGANGFGSTGA